MSNYLSYTGILRAASYAAGALITLSLGIFFAIKSGSNNNVSVLQIQTQDGRVKLNATSSGSLTMSGALRVRGAMSGGSLTAAGGSGNRIACWKSNGTMGYGTATPTNGIISCN